MKTAFQIFRRDVRRLLKNRAATLVMIGVCLLPSLYAWFNIAANMDPYANTSGIRVAIANCDTGTKTDVITMNAGDSIVEKLKENKSLGWQFVSEEYHIPKKFFQENDIHIHIPEGAVPKDGPSAGITMATAMLSAITKTPVRADVAMTGEITLRGRVLPIGGLKEKTLAAKNAGIKTICVPKKNEKDIDEISPEIKKGLEIVFVEQMKDVLDVAFVKK